MSEEQNIEDYKAALSWEEDSHWERGRLAHEWNTQYGNGRGDSAYAEMTGDSQQGINQHRRVFEAFTNRLVNVSWTHHLAALQACDWNAEAAKPWLLHAASSSESVRDMVKSILESQPKDEREPSLLEICQQLRKSVLGFRSKFPRERLDVFADQLRVLAEEITMPVDAELEKEMAEVE